ncbi:hypothetical protein HanPSC8_Chr05g0207361 [Helianthus annuus]|nr:hypothetical protein HanPSC8_Chr05g0207361 [Helianthus annuus]
MLELINLILQRARGASPVGHITSTILKHKAGGFCHRQFLRFCLIYCHPFVTLIKSFHRFIQFFSTSPHER